MDAARYARLCALAEEALGLDTAERPALIERTRAEDSELGRELELLCAHFEPRKGHTDARALLFEPAIDAARASLEELTQPAREDGLPARIGTYRILRRIGQGGMGVVYEAEQSAPQRRVALKMIPPSSGGAERMRRFKLEGEVLGRLHHPNIAQVYECGTADLGHGPQPFFAMEFVEGVDLYSFALRANLGIDAKLALVARVADAVQHAHERGVVHRDLKPDNVLVEASGEPKVLDFGIARASDSTALSAAMTRTGELVGTLAYMAPEQLSGQRGAISERVDVYALGVILYQLLVGRLPHEVAGLPITAAMQILAHAEPAPVTRLDPRLAGDVATIVAKAMEKDAERRYASAAALAADIRRCLEHMPIAARPASVTYRVAKMLRRNRTLVAGLVAVFLTLSIGLGATLWQAGMVRTAKGDVERQLYSANLQLAGEAIKDSQLAAARSLLDAAPDRLRGWEWRVLSAELDTTARKHERSIPPSSDQNPAALLPSRDGRSYFTRQPGNDGATRHYDLESGALLAELPNRAGSSSGASVLADGSGVALATLIPPEPPEVGQQLHLALWDGTNAPPRVLIDRLPGAADSVASWQQALPALDGVHVLLAGAELALWNMQTHRIEARTRSSTGDWVNRFSPDGTRVALCDQVGAVRIRDARTLALLAQTGGHTNKVYAVAFSADGTWLATGSDDASVRLWDLTQEPVQCLAVLPHEHPIAGLELDPGETWLASLTTDRTIHVWDRKSAALTQRFGSGELCEGVLAFLSEHEVAGLRADGSLLAWDVEAADTRILRGHAGPITRAAFAPALGLIVTCSWEGAVGHAGSLRLWDADTGEALASLLAPGRYVKGTIGGRNRTTLALQVVNVERSEVATMLVQLDTGRIVELEGADDIRAIDSEGARYAAISGTDLALAEIGGTTRKFTLGSDANPTSAAWSPDGRRLALGSWSQPAGTLVLDAAALSVDLRLASTPTNAVAFSPDGRLLATGARNGLVHLWNAASGALVAELVGHDLAILTLAFSPDGRRLASGGLDHFILLWDTTTFDPVARLGGHEDHVASLDWVGERLLSGSADNTARLWEPVPLRSRLGAREVRAAAVARVAPLVARLRAASSDFEQLFAALAAEPGLSARELEVARQLALVALLEQRLQK